jgi:hypothetical protein
MNWKSFLGLDQLPTWPIPKAPISYSIQKPRKVIGRILRQYDRNTLLVGVAGFVCQLELVDIPNGYPELLQYVRSGNKQVDREKEYLFHVVSAHHDRFGNPNIRLSLKPPGQHKQFNVSLQESSFLKGILCIDDRDSYSRTRFSTTKTRSWIECIDSITSIFQEEIKRCWILKSRFQSTIVQ